MKFQSVHVADVEHETGNNLYLMEVEVHFTYTGGGFSSNVDIDRVRFLNLRRGDYLPFPEGTNWEPVCVRREDLSECWCEYADAIATDIVRCGSLDDDLHAVGWEEASHDPQLYDPSLP